MKIKINKIIRSKRKTIGLQITNKASLIVRAPIFISSKYIKKLVEKKSGWIEKKQKDILEKSKNFKEKEFIDGEYFLYLGHKYKLKFVSHQEKNIIFDKKFYIPKNRQNNTKDIFENWYKKKALEKITQRIKFFSKYNNFAYKKIKLSNANTRWGTCGKNNNLIFSWKLIMAPLKVIDYVVVHELAHLIHKNHSPNFWKEVKLILPNYKKERAWLKNNGYLLKI